MDERSHLEEFSPPETSDVVVVGGGPAGLAAALGAKRAGAGDVLLIERERTLGGILNQCIHDGFGLFLYKETITGPEYVERLVEEVVRENIRVETGSMVLDIDTDRMLRVNSRNGYRLYRGRAVVLAMGCRERTRGMIGIPGSRPAGVFTAGTAQNLVNLRNLRIGRKAVVLGSGDIGLIMARRLTLEGIPVAGVFEIMPWAGGLERNVRQCLQDFGIPLELSTTIVEIRGAGRVESVVTARVDEGRNPIPGTEREVFCDTLLLSVGLIPENELSKSAGVCLSSLTGGAVVDERLMTSVPGLFSCGNVLHIHDVADWASEEGFAAGENAARFALEGGLSREKRRIVPGNDVQYCLPQNVNSGTSEVMVSFRVRRPLRNTRVIVRGAPSGNTYAQENRGRILPSELQKIKVSLPVEEDLEVGCHE